MQILAFHTEFKSVNIQAAFTCFEESYTAALHSSAAKKFVEVTVKHIPATLYAQQAINCLQTLQCRILAFENV